MSPGEIHAGQQEELPGGSHQRSGPLVATETVRRWTYRREALRLLVLLQVVDYYKEACRALENSETASMLGKIQKDWKKLVQMKIYYFAAIAHVSPSGCVCVRVCVCKCCDLTRVPSVASHGKTS